MKSFKVPASEASAEFVEKKSRFIGNIFKVESAEQASEIIKGMQKKFWDATHNVYAYVLQNGVMRFSDDGEPGGTAGMPTLEVLKKEEVMNVLCVTTRYFGGTLLGAGGLVRAYSHAAKIALDAAGIAVMQPFAQVMIKCPYSFINIIKRQYEHFDAEEENAEFAQDVTFSIFLPMEKYEAFRDNIIDVTKGGADVSLIGEKMFAKKLK